MSYSDVAELVTLFGEFKETHPQQGMSEFGRWLMIKKSHSESKQLMEIEPSDDFSDYIRERTPTQQLGILIGRIFRFARFYSKKNMSDLNLTLEEFGFLAGTHRLGNPTKSELITMNLLEPTSGTEILKRLINLGLLTETENDQDKRSKRISISEKGMGVLVQAFERMGNMAFFMAGNLSDEEVTHLVRSLQYLNDFHTYHYLQNRDMSMNELIDTFIEKK